MAIARLEISQGDLSMKKLFYLLLLPALSAESAFSQQLNLLETVIQSPGGWRLIGVNREALVFWMQPSEAKGDATDRAVPKASAAPGRRLRRSSARLAPMAQQQWTAPSRPQGDGSRVLTLSGRSPLHRPPSHPRLADLPLAPPAQHWECGLTLCSVVGSRPYLVPNP